MKDVVNFGVVGCGYIAEAEHLPAYQRVSNARLVAVADIDEGRAEGAAKAFGAKRWFTDYRKLLELDEVEAIDICTPHYPLDLHSPVAIDGAEAGKHILVEKPMSISLTGALRMIRACERNGVKLMVAYPRRYEHATIKAKELMQEGIIGKVNGCLSLQLEMGEPPFYPRLIGPTSRMSVDQGNSKGFELDQITLDLLNGWIHHLNLIRFYLGDPASVQAILASANMFFLEFDDGAVANSYSRGISEDNTIQIFGERGSIKVWLWKAHFPYFYPQLKVYRRRSENSEPNVRTIVIPHWNSFEKEIEHFASCILNDKVSNSSGKDSIKDLHVIFAARKADREHKKIRIEY